VDSNSDGQVSSQEALPAQLHLFRLLQFFFLPEFIIQWIIEVCMTMCVRVWKQPSTKSSNFGIWWSFASSSGVGVRFHFCTLSMDHDIPFRWAEIWDFTGGTQFIYISRENLETKIGGSGRGPGKRFRCVRATGTRRFQLWKSDPGVQLASMRPFPASFSADHGRSISPSTLRRRQRSFARTARVDIANYWLLVCTAR
jgi:hypothetical protein